MQIDDEIPLLPTLTYLFRCLESYSSRVLVSGIKSACPLWHAGDLRERHSQVGSLAGAAHLLKDNTGVLR